MSRYIAFVKLLTLPSPREWAEPPFGNSDECSSLVSLYIRIDYNGEDFLFHSKDILPLLCKPHDELIPRRLTHNEFIRLLRTNQISSLWIKDTKEDIQRMYCSTMRTFIKPVYPHDNNNDDDDDVKYDKLRAIEIVN